MPYADTTVDELGVARVDSYADTLGISPETLGRLHQVRDEHFRRMGIDHGRRGPERPVGPGFGRRTTAVVEALRHDAGDPTLAARYRALAEHEPGTLGHAFHAFARDRGFPLPGEPRSLGEVLVPHDCAHIVGGFGTDRFGEIAVRGFEAAMARDGFGYELVVEAMLDRQLVDASAPGLAGEEAPDDEIDIDQLMVGIEGGLKCAVDLLARGWDFWAVAGTPLEELRRDYDVHGAADIVEPGPPA